MVKATNPAKRHRGPRFRPDGGSLGTYPHQPKSHAPEHATVTTRVGVNRTRHNCPQCSYVALIDWSTKPFTRLVSTPSDATDGRTVHLDREVLPVA